MALEFVFIRQNDNRIREIVSGAWALHQVLIFYHRHLVTALKDLWTLFCFVWWLTNSNHFYKDVYVGQKANERVCLEDTISVQSIQEIILAIQFDLHFPCQTSCVEFKCSIQLATHPIKLVFLILIKRRFALVAVYESFSLYHLFNKNGSLVGPNLWCIFWEISSSFIWEITYVIRKLIKNYI